MNEVKKILKSLDNAIDKKYSRIEKEYYKLACFILFDEISKSTTTTTTKGQTK